MILKRAVAIGLLIALPPHPVGGQPFPFSNRTCSDVKSPSQRSTCSSVDRLRLLLASSDVSDRCKAYLLVGARNDDASWQVLNEHLAKTNPERSALEDLVLARVVAPNLRRPIARNVALQLVNGTSARLDPSLPERSLALQVCFMALAWSQAPDALTELGRRLQHGGPVASAAVQALLAHPPMPFERLFAPHIPHSPEWARLLGLSKHASSIPVLRKAFLDGTPELQLAAAKALLRLGDRSMQRLVRRSSEDRDVPEDFQRLAQHGTSFHQPELRKDFALGWSVASNANSILDRVRNANMPASLLAKGSGPGQQQTRLTALLLGEFGAGKASKPSTEWLKSKLSNGNRPLAFVATALLSKLQPEALFPGLEARDSGIERAIAWALPYLEADSPLHAPIAERLLKEDPATTRTLLCSGLIQKRIHRSLPTQWLSAMAFGTGLCAALASGALAERDSTELRSLLRVLLWSPHPLIRAAVARGLGSSVLPSASGMLLDRFKLEGEVRVRRAILRALARRNSHLGHQTLLDSARFDPDPMARRFAVQGALGTAVDASPGDPLGFGLAAPSSCSPAVLSLDASTVRGTATTAVPIASGPDGASIPVPQTPDGLILLPVANAFLRVESWSPR